MKFSTTLKMASIACLGLFASAIHAADDDDEKMSRSEKATANFWERYMETGETRKCVAHSRIDRTRALSDDLIYFEMRGKKHFVNKLPRSCRGLFFENRIMYKISAVNLCDLDTITVLDSFGRERMVCGLGEFVEVTRKPKDEASQESSD